MKNPTPTVEKKSIHPFRVNQAIVAMELSEIDDSLLSYFNEFKNKIPVSSAYFIHVIPEIARLMEFFQKEAHSIIGGYSFDESIIRTLEKKIKKAITEAGEMKMNYDLQEGDPMTTILGISEKIDAGLVMIGQRTDTDNHGIFANKLARHSKGNALIVPQGASCKFNDILVPIDFSPNSVRAFQTALGIRKQVGKQCRIHCLNVYSLPSLSHFKLDRPWIQFKNIVEENINDSFKAFVHTYSQGETEGVDTFLVEKDLPGTARYIAQFIDDNNTDMVILGAKGHSKIERLLMGSTTEKLLQINKNTPCLVVK